MFYVAQIAARHMWERDGGVILQTASTNGIVGQPYYADYNALDSLNHTVTPLWDFFRGPQRDFTYINPINSADTAS